LAAPHQHHLREDLTTGPIIRIFLRYATFSLLYFSLIRENEASDLIADPEIAQ